MWRRARAPAQELIDPQEAERLLSETADYHIELYAKQRRLLLQCLREIQGELRCELDVDYQ